MIRKNTKIQTGKTYTVTDARGTYTIIVGDMSESTDTPTTDSTLSNMHVGVGAPSLGLGKIGGIYVDSLNKRVYVKDAIGWDSGFDMGGSAGSSEFKVGVGTPSLNLSSSISAYIDMQSMTFHTRSGGSWDEGRLMRGNAGSNGKSVRFGNGPPISSLGENDETYIDLNDFKIHTKSSGLWSSGQVFKGNNGQNGKSIRFGNGLPSDGAGDDDEVYLDLSNFKVHTKSTGSWGSGLAFKGNDGSSGKDGSDGSPGKDGVVAQLTNDSDVIPTDSDGTGYDFTDTGGEFELRAGGSKITSGVTYYAGTTGTGSSTTVNGLTLTITSGGAYTLSGASWSQPFAKFTMRAVHDGVTYTKVYKVTKARSGIKGGDGLPGNNGKDGTDGTDALSGYLSNEADVLPAANDGTGYSFADTGGTFYVYSGKTQVSPTNFYVGAAGTATSQTINGLTLSITSGGVYSLSGASWTTDSVTFTLRAVYSGVTLSKVYKATKSKAGSKGDIGATGPGVKVYSVALGSDSSTSDVELTTSYSDMYLADVMTDEGNILTASSVRGGTTTFTISQTGRYRIELQAAFRIKNSATDSTTYAATGYAQILKDGVSLVSGNVSMTAAAPTSTFYFPKFASGTVVLEKKIRLTAGTVLKVQAKTSSTTSTKKTYLELATDSESQTTEDTILTITKL